MINIIEQGKNTQSVELTTFRANCPLCRCKFTFDTRDLETFYGKEKAVKGVRCPNCENIVYNNCYCNTGKISIQIPIKSYVVDSYKNWKELEHE